MIDGVGHVLMSEEETRCSTPEENRPSNGRDEREVDTESKVSRSGTYVNPCSLARESKSFSSDRQLPSSPCDRNWHRPPVSVPFP
jgi:hypothetical protein